MLNMDMIGRLDTNRVIYVVGTSSSVQWDKLIKLVENKSLKITPSENFMGGSDHYPFYLKGIPFLFFFTGLHSDYHTPDDDLEKINFDGEIKILNFIEDFITIIDTVAVIPFQIIDEISVVHHSNKNNSIGLIPDKEYNGKGIRIAGVIKDLLACNTGLQPGDVIMKIGNKDIKDYHDFTETLKKYDPGTQAKLLVSRMGTQIIKTVYF